MGLEQAHGRRLKLSRRALLYWLFPISQPKHQINRITGKFKLVIARDPSHERFDHIDSEEPSDDELGSHAAAVHLVVEVA